MPEKFMPIRGKFVVVITAPQLQSCNDFLNNVSLIQNPVLLE